MHIYVCCSILCSILDGLLCILPNRQRGFMINYLIYSRYNTDKQITNQTKVQLFRESLFIEKTNKRSPGVFIILRLCQVVNKVFVFVFFLCSIYTINISKRVSSGNSV